MKSMKPEYILAHEWIGLEVEVVYSPNQYEVGLKGIVINETMNTLTLRTEEGYKIVAKRGRTFKVRFKGYVLRVKGDLIAFRPEERIKRGLMLIKKAKGWW
jgi:ribonuclease P protein subunit POP4